MYIFVLLVPLVVLNFAADLKPAAEWVLWMLFLLAGSLSRQILPWLFFTLCYSWKCRKKEILGNLPFHFGFSLCFPSAERKMLWYFCSATQLCEPNNFWEPSKPQHKICCQWSLCLVIFAYTIKTRDSGRMTEPKIDWVAVLTKICLNLIIKKMLENGKKLTDYFRQLPCDWFWWFSASSTEGEGIALMNFRIFPGFIENVEKENLWWIPLY